MLSTMSATHSMSAVATSPQSSLSKLLSERNILCLYLKIDTSIIPTFVSVQIQNYCFITTFGVIIGIWSFAFAKNRK